MTNEQIQLLSIYVALGVGVVSIIISVLSLRQNSKMIEDSTRPYIVVYQAVTNFQNISTYLVVKNFGSSGAVIESFECDKDLVSVSYMNDRTPFDGVEGSFIAPKQSILCNIDKSKVTNENEELDFQIKYKSQNKTYVEHCKVNLNSNKNNMSSRASTDNKELRIISYTLQDLVEKNL